MVIHPFLYLALLIPGLAASPSHERRLLNSLLHDKVDSFNNSHNPLERPVEDSRQLVPLQLGGTLYQVIDLDEKNQILTSTWWLDLTWRDYWFQWDPAQFGGIKDIRLPPAKVWMPDLILYNSANENFDATFPTNVLVFSNGTMQQIPPGIFKSTCKIDINFFPFDTQRCRLTFGTWTYNGLYVNLTNKASEAGLKSYTPNSEFFLVSANIYRETYEDPCCLGEFITITFELVLERRTLYYFSNLILPCVLIASMAVIGFLFPPDSGEKLTLQITVLMSLTFFMNMVSDMQPPSSDTPLLFVYFLSIMVLVASSVVCTIFILNFHHRLGDSQVMRPWISKVFLQWLPWLLRMSLHGEKITRRSIDLKRKLRNLQKIEEEAPTQSNSLTDVLDMHHDYVKAESFYSFDKQCRTNAWINQNMFQTRNLPSLNNSPETARARERDSAARGVEKELVSIRKELTVIANKIRKDAHVRHVESEWKFAAMVLDRLCLIIFTTFTIALFAALLILAPKIIVT